MATFRRGTPGNTFATFPTRSFSFLVDPTALPELGVPKNMGALFLIRDLGALEWPVDVTLLWPTYIDHVSPAGVSETVAILLGDIWKRCGMAGRPGDSSPVAIWPRPRARPLAVRSAAAAGDPAGHEPEGVTICSFPDTARMTAESSALLGESL